VMAPRPFSRTARPTPARLNAMRCEYYTGANYDTDDLDYVLGIINRMMAQETINAHPDHGGSAIALARARYVHAELISFAFKHFETEPVETEPER
jgi:hypothetical protein